MIVAVANATSLVCLSLKNNNFIADIDKMSATCCQMLCSFDTPANMSISRVCNMTEDKFRGEVLLLLDIRQADRVFATCPVLFAFGGMVGRVMDVWMG